MNIEEIRDYCIQHKIRWTRHIFLRLTQRGITMSDVESVIMNGEIIESYPDDYPSPSCLILGFVNDSTPVHVVCGIHEGELWLITAYYPNPEEWSEDYRTRKE